MEVSFATRPARLHFACSLPPRPKGEESGEEVQSCWQGILLPHDYK